MDADRIIYGLAAAGVVVIADSIVRSARAVSKALEHGFVLSVNSEAEYEATSKRRAAIIKKAEADAKAAEVKATEEAVKEGETKASSKEPVGFKPVETATESREEFLKKVDETLGNSEPKDK